MRVHGADGARDYEAGETYYWAPGHNLEAVTDAEYLEITRVRGLRRADGALQARHGGLSRPARARSWLRASSAPAWSPVAAPGLTMLTHDCEA